MSELVKENPTLRDCQAFHAWFDEQKGFSHDLPLNMMLLVEEVGEVAKEVRRLVHAADNQQKQQEARQHLQEELADCLAYIAKLANYTGIDLEKAYVDKMKYNMQRVWTE